MVLALFTILGRRYRLVLEEDVGSLPPPTIDTLAEPLEQGPSVARALPSNVLAFPARRAG